MSKDILIPEKVNGNVAREVAQKWGVTVQFVGQAVRGKKQSPTAKSIKQDYRDMLEAVEKAIEAKSQPKPKHS